MSYSSPLTPELERDLVGSALVAELTDAIRGGKSFDELVDDPEFGERILQIAGDEAFLDTSTYSEGMQIMQEAFEDGVQLLMRHGTEEGIARKMVRADLLRAIFEVETTTGPLPNYAASPLQIEGPSPEQILAVEAYLSDPDITDSEAAKREAASIWGLSLSEIDNIFNRK